MIAIHDLTSWHNTRQMQVTNNITSEAVILGVGFNPLSRQTGVCTTNRIAIRQANEHTAYNTVHQKFALTCSNFCTKRRVGRNSSSTGCNRIGRTFL
jgi:hypothetical protein